MSVIEVISVSLYVRGALEGVVSDVWLNLGQHVQLLT